MTGEALKWSIRGFFLKLKCENLKVFFLAFLFYFMKMMKDECR